MLFEVRKVSAGVDIDHVNVSKIDFPIMGGGPSTCTFSAFEEIDLSTEIEIKEKNGLVTRFEGYIRRRSRTRNKEKYLGQEWSYTAVCKAYWDAAQTNYNVTDYGDELIDFSGNGVEYQEFLYQENANAHILWPPTGSDVVIWLDTESASSLPSNIISVAEVEENNLPSHVKIEVKKYREKRFPCISDFVVKKVTKDMIETPAYANYGKNYKIMNPADATEEYTDAPLFSATVGGSKLFVKGHTSLTLPQKLNYAYSASINTKKKNRTLKKVGGADGVNTAINSRCAVQMTFFPGYQLPRVTQVHGTASDKSEMFVRARVLEGIFTYTQSIGGINKQDRLPALNHTEIEVEYDTVEDSKYRDWTYNGPKGLLHATDDNGGGVWDSDLSGTYIEEEGVSRGQAIISKALEHYENIRYTTDFEFAGINWDFLKKITYENKNICLDSIAWSFGIDPAQDKTRYAGVRLLFGFSPNLAKKMKWLVKQEKEREEKRNRKQPVVAPTSDSEVKTPEYARIAWAYDVTNGDMSEAEFVTKNGDLWTASEKTCWIDSVGSQGITFKTAGNLAIFEIEKVLDKLTRNMVVRDCYRIKRCVEDKGTQFTHFSTDNKVPLLCVLIGDDIANPNWQDIYDGDKDIKTTIYNTITGTNEEKTNIMKVLTTDEGDLSGYGDFLYLRKSVYINNYPFAALPIQPRLVDKAAKTWESAVELGGTSIATYLRKI